MSIIRLRTLLLALALALVTTAGGTGVAQATPCSGVYRTPVNSGYNWTQDACLFVDGSGYLVARSLVHYLPAFNGPNVKKVVAKFRLRDQTNGSSYQAPDITLSIALAQNEADTVCGYRFGKGTVGHYYYVEAWLQVTTGLTTYNSGRPTRYPITGVLRR